MGGATALAASVRVELCIVQTIHHTKSIATMRTWQDIYSDHDSETNKSQKNHGRLVELSHSKRKDECQKSCSPQAPSRISSTALYLDSGNANEWQPTIHSIATETHRPKRSVNRDGNRLPTEEMQEHNDTTIKSRWQNVKETRSHCVSDTDQRYRLRGRGLDLHDVIFQYPHPMSLGYLYVGSQETNE